MWLTLLALALGAQDPEAPLSPAAPPLGAPPEPPALLTLPATPAMPPEPPPLVSALVVDEPDLVEITEDTPPAVEAPAPVARLAPTPNRLSGFDLGRLHGEDAAMDQLYVRPFAWGALAGVLAPGCGCLLVTAIQSNRDPEPAPGDWQEGEQPYQSGYRAGYARSAQRMRVTMALAGGAAGSLVTLYILSQTL